MPRPRQYDEQPDEMIMIKNILNSRITLGILLALPAIPLLAGMANGTMSIAGALHPSGETSARLMIIALMITPLRVIFPKAKWLYWMLRRRRDFGVAAFFYAALHTILYLVDTGSMAAVINELTQGGIWTGWLAFLIFVPLAMTSNDMSVRLLGRMWKTVQRLAYPAAVLTLLHWSLVSAGIGGALVHFMPLAILQVWRIFKTAQPKALAHPG